MADEIAELRRLIGQLSEKVECLADENTELKRSVHELTDEAAEHRQSIKSQMIQHRMLRQQMMGLQTLFNVEHEKIDRILYIMEAYGDVRQVFKDIATSEKSMTIQLSPEQKEILATQSFLDVAGQVDSIRYHLIETQEKMVKLVNWVSAKVDPEHPFELDRKPNPGKKPERKNKMKKIITFDPPRAKHTTSTWT